MTLKQIAAAAGVSRPTANLIVLGKGERFSAATRARVMEAARALNYRPSLAARGFSERRSYLVAALVSEEYTNSYPEFSVVFQHRVLDRGCLPVTALTADAAGQKQMLARMAEVRIDALVINRCWSDEDGSLTRLIEQLRGAGVSVVELFMNYLPGVPSVRIDWEEAGRLALVTLQGLGLKRPAMWTPLLPRTGGRIETLEETHDQYRGWARAARALGVPAPLAVHPALPLRSQEGPRRGSPLYEAAAELMEGPGQRPDGVMACSTNAAAHLSLYLRDHPQCRPTGFTIAHWHDPIVQVEPAERRVILRLQTERLAELAVEGAFAA
ncbi:MAG: LacI family transcriptional regulator, partial [Thermoleophilia bacterium]|nr:LacI family transcriptional regulator [Thermoleophilia bacterium]